MVKHWTFFLIATLWMSSISGAVYSVDTFPDATLYWEDYASLQKEDILNIHLSDPGGEIQIFSLEAIEILSTIKCNGALKISSEEASIRLLGKILAPQVILEAKKILLEPYALIDTSMIGNGGFVYVGGGWQGQNPEIAHATYVEIRNGAQIIANAQANGDGGTVVLFSDKVTFFHGEIIAKGAGSGNGGKIEVSSKHLLIFDGATDCSSETGIGGELLLDPINITIQATSPDIDGNNTGLDITLTTQLDDATTTPAGFPNAASIITAGALDSLLTTGSSLTLAAQNFITVNAPLAPAGTNVTLTFSAPTVNLNAPINLPSGGVLVGIGVNTVNVGASGKPQNGVDFVASGGTVNLATATYPAPINILSKNFILNGNGQANTTIQVQGAVPSHLSRNPAIYLQNTTTATIQNLAVDGNYIGFPTNPSIVGILFDNGGGTVSNTHITKMANNAPPFLGGQQGIGIRAVSSFGGPYTLNITSNLIDFFQKAAVVANGPQFAVNIANNTITGLGTPSTPASIGIQVSQGSGTITGNTVSGIQYTDHAQSDGILTLNTGANFVISGNVITGNDEGILGINYGPNTTIQNNTVQNSGDSGIVVLDTTGTVNIDSNQLLNNGGLSAPSNPNTSIYISSTSNQVFNVTGNTIQPNAGTTGILSQGSSPGAGPLTSLSNNVFLDP